MSDEALSLSTHSFTHRERLDRQWSSLMNQIFPPSTTRIYIYEEFCDATIDGRLLTFSLPPILLMILLAVELPSIAYVAINLDGGARFLE